jgi:hypothetical protein
VSAHSASHRGGWLSALVAQVSDWVFEEVEETVEPRSAQLEPQPVVAVVAAAPRAGASTVARLLAAEMAGRGSGAAVVVASTAPRRHAPPSRAAIRVATALAGVGPVHPVGRLCVVPRGAGDPSDAPSGAARAADASGADPGPARARIDRIAAMTNAARYLAPVVLDLPADGSGAGIAALVDRVVVVGAGSAEPALLDAVAGVVGGDAIRVANRIVDPGDWAERADFVLPDSRVGVRAAALGTRAIGSLGAGMHALADALEGSR